MVANNEKVVTDLKTSVLSREYKRRRKYICMYIACITFNRCRMIVISVILAVIGSFIIHVLIKVIDKRREILSMERQSRLSLKRNRYQEYVINKVSVEISDDESSDSLTNLQSSIEQVNCTNTTSGMAYISNDATDGSNPACSLNTHDLSDDLSSDDDVVVIDVPTTSKNSRSMFNWKKTSFAGMAKSQNSMSSVNILHDSRLEKEREESNKKQKLMFDLSSSNNDVDDDDVVSLKNFKEKASPPKVTIQHDIMIAGTKVTLPVKPYPCQKAVMNSLIKGCAKEQHCLLESPTGSGKTLALLCGALAWQGQYSENLRKESNGIDVAGSSCSCDEDLDDNFFLNSSQYFDEEWCDKVLNKAKSQKVPKIYYGTRTHKQIEQVVRELKKTVYKHKRMTILSSRKHTCIQNTNKNKDELCNELLDPLKFNKCPYYDEQSKKKMTWFSKLGTPWDIEDLVSLGRDIEICPYFGARSLMAEAEIIFCPYNYIVNPSIRESMQINLKGNIVILDEAHNIEDVCRAAASVEFRDDELEIAAHDCEYVSYKYRNHDRENYITIQKYLNDIIKFLGTIDVKQNVNDYWLGAEFLVLLDMNNIGSARFPEFHYASKMAIQDFEKVKQEQSSRPDKTIRIISRETKKILEHLCFVIQMLTSDISVNDYRVCVTESMEPSKRRIPEDVWISTKKKKPARILKLLCMNPAIIFAPLARTARSVILASGTLTPITSFQSELGTRFSHIVNPDHIISKEQVYVRCIPRGPNGKTLMANFEHVNSWNFQDELGSLILQVCDAVPYGVLCFFSSYTVMKMVHDRWKSNGTWKKLMELKEIFVETKNNEDMHTMMKDYRNVIEESSSKSINVASGAILFAVFRGKVAEGIDFSDNEARCVLAVGIPYKNKTDVSLSMKMNYNDSNKSKGFLSGSEWYTVDAFRASNQALGRCIRHKNDWGAVLLVDERYQDQRRINYLPKWIRTKWLHNGNYDLQTELEDFVAIQVAREKSEKCIKSEED